MNGDRRAVTQPRDPAVTQPRDPAVTVTPYRDGPLLIRGDFQITDTDGSVIDAGRSTVALCRCGRSALKPFCDGSHRLTGFHAPSGQAMAREPGRSGA